MYFDLMGGEDKKYTQNKSMEINLVIMILKYYLFYFLCFFGGWNNPSANWFDYLIGCFSCLNYVQHSSNYHFYGFHCFLIGKVSPR